VAIGKASIGAKYVFLQETTSPIGGAKVCKRTKNFYNSKIKPMTKEEYFLTDWKSDLGMRAVASNGWEYYHATEPEADQRGKWTRGIQLGFKYKPEDVKGWWNKSYQTKKQYLQLIKDQTND
jgi:hypothetical protein